MGEIVYCMGDDLSDRQRESIWEILKGCDAEFYPPLSQRTSTSQKNLDSRDLAQQREAAAAQPDPDAGPRAYYDEMIRQEFLLDMEGEEMAGFMTFRRAYVYEKLPDPYNPSLYMTTACVRKAWREHGIMSRLYTCMEREMTVRFSCPYVTTRTWSTNDAQMWMLPQRGYEKLLVLPEDRGPGVDTVYFGMTV